MRRFSKRVFRDKKAAPLVPHYSFSGILDGEEKKIIVMVLLM